MIKSTILLSNLLFLTMVARAQQGVKISHNIPQAVKQGSEFIVDVAVDKKGVEGFAKLQFSLPIGLSASSVESNGATFSFKDQLVNFVWMSLPEVESFKISYKINVSSTVFGEDSVTGNFNYMHSNEKQTYRVPSTIVDIQLPGASSAPVAAAAPKAVAPVKQAEDTAKKIVQEIKQESTELPKVIESQTPTAEVNSAAKPVTAEVVKTAPAEPVAEAPKPVAEVVKQAVVEKPVMAEKPIESPKPVEPVKPVAVAKPVEAPKPIEKPKPAEVKAEKPAPKLTGVPAQAGVVFKVQIAAMGSQPKADAFSALSEITNFKSPEGLSKYYTGNFKTYDDAAKHLINVKEKGFEQAFIAAFKNGAPISVKEALGK